MRLQGFIGFLNYVVFRHADQLQILSVDWESDHSEIREECEFVIAEQLLASGVLDGCVERSLEAKHLSAALEQNWHLS